MPLKNKSTTDLALSWILLIVLSLIWGSSFILIKKSLIGFPASVVGGLRVVFAALFLLPWAFKNLRELSKDELKYLFVVGMSGSLIPAILFAYAETQLDSSIAGVLNSLTPMFVLIIGAVFFSQGFGVYSVSGVLLGLVGSVFLIFGFSIESLSDINFYAFFVILATVLYGLNLNIIKYKLLRVKPVQITSVSVTMVLPLATAYLVFFTPVLHIQHFSDKIYSFGAIATLGVMGTGVALLLFNKLVKVSSTLFTSSVTYLIPIVAILWGILDGESLLFNHYIGLIFILSGILMINRPPKK